MAAKPKLAVFKFASCDGCQLSLLDAEEELLAVCEAVEVAYFLEARTQEIEGPYDVGLVEGSVKNWANVNDYINGVYAHPEYISTLATSTPISDHVPVDFELRGCPINKNQLVQLVADLLHGRKLRVPTYAVCVECKRRGTVCVAVAQGIACWGPVTQAGCGVICPSYNRDCYGCFGPKDAANPIGITWPTASRPATSSDWLGTSTATPPNSVRRATPLPPTHEPAFSPETEVYPCPPIGRLKSRPSRAWKARARCT
jgi:sulfhydrogenase subunit delta